MGGIALAFVKENVIGRHYCIEVEYDGDVPTEENVRVALLSYGYSEEEASSFNKMSEWRFIVEKDGESVNYNVGEMLLDYYEDRVLAAHEDEFFEEEDEDI